MNDAKRLAAFLQGLRDLRPPQYEGYGVRSKQMNITVPHNSGRFFLAGTLTGMRLNKKVVFTNAPY